MAGEDTYKQAKRIFEKFKAEIAKAIVGQEALVENVMISIVTGSHALLEGAPGLGKTMTIRAISEALDLDFSRIQCTPDLMPSDITGTYLIEEDAKTGKKEFRFRQGPIFSNIVLADEINRATPKTQAALLEAMQEKQVTSGSNTFTLKPPFFVLATQNPIEMEGTYPLPEAQLDRFLFKILVDYPKPFEEEKIVRIYTAGEAPEIKKVISSETLIELGKLATMVPISEELLKYVVSFVAATRPGEGNETANKYLDYGASPRAAIGIVKAARARALLYGNNFASKADVEAMALPVLRHRLILNFESERQGISTDDVTRMILKEAK